MSTQAERAAAKASRANEKSYLRFRRDMAKLKDPRKRMSRAMDFIKAWASRAPDPRDVRHAADEVDKIAQALYRGRRTQ